MPNPADIDCVQGEWTQVAEGVTNCIVWIKALDPGSYYIDRRLSGSAVPTDLSFAHTIMGGKEDISTISEIDIYVWAIGKNGKVIVDLTADPTGKNTYSLDQTSQPIEYFLTTPLNDITIAAAASARTNTLVLEPGHEVVPLDLIEIFQEGLGPVQRFTQLRVVSVSGDTVRLGQFIGFDVDPGAVTFARRVSSDMNVSGTIGAPVKFSQGPPNGFQWNVARAMIGMVLDTNPDDALFGDLPVLANGMFSGRESDVNQNYLLNIYDNSDLRLTAYDVDYTTRSSGGGSYGLAARKSFAGPDKYGVAIRLNGSQNTRFVAYVQDDLTDLVQFRVKIQGHVTKE